MKFFAWTVQLVKVKGTRNQYEISYFSKEKIGDVKDTSLVFNVRERAKTKLQSIINRGKLPMGIVVCYDSSGFCDLAYAVCSSKEKKFYLGKGIHIAKERMQEKFSWQRS